MINEALGFYDFSDPSAELIRHNENMTYRVGGKYLLRIHKPKDGFTTGPLYEGLNRAELYKNELAFITHLKKCGMNVQTPIPNKNGELVTILSNGTPVTVLTWLEGHIIDKSELSPSLCREMGVMMAKLHSAAKSFPPFPAMSYDVKLCERLVRKMNEAKEAGFIDSDHCAAISSALSIIGKFLLESNDESIIVHSDLSLSNMLITPSGLAPIDFSLFGYGHPMMDISALYCVINGGTNRRAIMEGYKEFGGKIDFHGLECTFAFNVLLGIVLHIELWTKEEWFAEKLSKWCKNIFKPLAEEKSVLDMTLHTVFASESDIPGWLTLVNEVKDDFPGLQIDSYTVTLEKNIARKTAICIKEDGKVVGILLFSPHHHCLSCMAVHPGYRRRGIASAMISEMLRQMPEDDISVTTFRENDPKGTAPRALYQSFGFEPDELMIEFDYPVQKFVLRR